MSHHINNVFPLTGKAKKISCSRNISRRFRYKPTRVTRLYVNNNGLRFSIFIWWWSTSFLIEHVSDLVTCYVWFCFLNNFGWSELMLRKFWRSVLLLNILLCNTAQTLKFPLRFSSVNVTKSENNCGFDRELLIENFLCNGIIFNFGFWEIKDFYIRNFEFYRVCVFSWPFKSFKSSRIWK